MGQRRTRRQTRYPPEWDYPPEWEERPGVERARRPSRFWRSLKSLAAGLVLLGVIIVFGIAALRPHSARCELCGTAVREWTDVTLTQRFSNLPRYMLASITGGVTPTRRVRICQGCRARVDAMFDYTQTPEFEAFYQREKGER